MRTPLVALCALALFGAGRAVADSGAPPGDAAVGGSGDTAGAVDSDGDGLTDAVEITLGTDPYNGDSDGGAGQASTSQRPPEASAGLVDVWVTSVCST